MIGEIIVCIFLGSIVFSLLKIFNRLGWRIEYLEKSLVDLEIKLNEKISRIDPRKIAFRECAESQEIRRKNQIDIIKDKQRTSDGLDVAYSSQVKRIDITTKIDTEYDKNLKDMERIQADWFSGEIKKIAKEYEHIKIETVFRCRSCFKDEKYKFVSQNNTTTQWGVEHDCKREGKIVYSEYLEPRNKK